MERPVVRQVFLRYSGDASYLKYFINELQRQLEKSHTIDVYTGSHTATARAALNIPGLAIEWEYC